MKIDQLSFVELKNLQTAVSTELKRRQVHEKRQLVKNIRQIVESHGFSLEDLLSPTEEGARTVNAVKPKYRHIQDPFLTWTGRGKKPRWVQSWLDGGGDMNDLLIDKNDE